MKRFGKFLALTALSISTAVAIPAAPAFAGGDGIGYSSGKYGQGSNKNYWRYGGEWRDGRHYRRHHGRYYRDHNNGNAAAALGLGLALGAVAGGVIASNRAPAYSGGSVEPWTRDWYRYCDNKYRSFNPDTGYYRGYDGRDHFCRVP